MVDRKSDDPAGTPGARIWKGDDAGPKPKPRSSAMVTAPRERWDDQRNWLNRAPSSPNARHAAITGALHSFSSYKSWADRVKNGWDKDK